MVATSPSMRSHSWSDVNSVVIANPLAFVGIGNEGGRRDPQRQSLAAQFGKHQAADCMRRWQIAHRDRRADAGAKAARGDLADLFGGSCVRKQRYAIADPDAALPPQSATASRG